MCEGLGDHPLINPGVGVLPGRADQPARARGLIPALPACRNQPPQRQGLEHPQRCGPEYAEHGVDAGEPGPHVRPGHLGIDQCQDPTQERDQQATGQDAVRGDAQLGPAGPGIGADQLLGLAAGLGVPDQPRRAGIGPQVPVADPGPALGDPPAVSPQEKPAQPSHITGCLAQPIPDHREGLHHPGGRAHPPYQQQHPGEQPGELANDSRVVLLGE
ncbi:MAG: hypothetical protein WBR33_09370 [Pseudonocardiaceae bacterium]